MCLASDKFACRLELVGRRASFCPPNEIIASSASHRKQRDRRDGDVDGLFIIIINEDATRPDSGAHLTLVATFCNQPACLGSSHLASSRLDVRPSVRPSFKLESCYLRRPWISRWVITINVCGWMRPSSTRRRRRSLERD